jgi:hypothetical protein
MRYNCIYYILLLFGNYGAFSQNQIGQDLLPSPQDTLYFMTDKLPENIRIGNPGANKWNQIFLNAPFAKSTIFHPASQGNYSKDFEGADMVIIKGEEETYLKRNGDELMILGYSGIDFLGYGIKSVCKFEKPYIWLETPIEYDSYHQYSGKLIVPLPISHLPSQYTKYLPYSPNEIRVVFDLVRDDYNDAHGELNLPQYSFDVLKQTRVLTTTKRLEIRRKDIPWQNVSSLIPGNAFGSGTKKTEHWFFNEFEKMFVSRILVSEDERSIQEVEYRVDRYRQLLENDLEGKPNIFAFPNPTFGKLKFDLNNLTPGYYTIKVFNVLGIELWKDKIYINQSKTISEDFSHLKKGTYFYGLENEKGRTIVTKRLVILRP